MKIWVDAQLSPQIATWIRDEFGIDTTPVRSLGLIDAEDQVIFEAAKNAGAVVLTKDRDFLSLSDRFGSPPQIIWLTCGNTSNIVLRKILRETLTETIEMLNAGERIVEISTI